MSEKRYMYRVSYGSSIKRVEVIKATNCFVTFIHDGFSGPVDRKESIRDFYDTWDEARESLLLAAQTRVQSSRRNLELANAAVGNIKGLKNPEA